MTISARVPEPSREQPLSRVWQPLQLGPTTLKNRLVVPARALNYAVDGVISDRHLATYRELARGGPAVIITEQHAAHRVSKGSFYHPCSAWEYSAIPQFEKFAAIVEEHDCRGFVQLFGPGVHDKGTMMMDEWHPLWGVSRIPSFVHGEVPMVMDAGHVGELVRGFGRAADNVRKSGLHGVEIHAAHSYLLGQFLSKTYNDRTDAYGGSVQNRCRAIVEAATEIREQVGNDITVGIRLSYDEFLGPAGIEPEEAEAQIRVFAGTGLFDYFSISGGSYHTLHMAVPPMGSVPEGWMVPFAKRAKELIADRAAVFTVGRIRDLHMAEDALASGSADAVAMGRAQLADPHLVRKTKEGRESEIIRCVGMNECIGRLFDQREVICAMNPVTGREAQWGEGSLRPARQIKDVLVVGGGPAGMKVAAVAASRGHKVRLVERDSALGGHFKILQHLPGRDEWRIGIDNLVRAVENAGVDVQLNTEISAETLEAETADAIIFATGARYDMSGLSPFRPDRAGIPGADQDHVIDVKTAAVRAIEDPASLGKKILILDESGVYLPLGLAEILRKGGASVEVITPAMFVGEQTLRQLDLPHVFPRLRAAGIELTSQHSIDSIDGTRVTIFDLWGADPRIEDDVDTVVLALYRLPNDDLFHRATDNGFGEVHRVGDCLAPRQPAAIIYDGEKLGREL